MAYPTSPKVMLDMLFVAPERQGLPALDVREELDRLRQIPGLDVSGHIGPITRTDLAALLCAPHTIITIAAHGRPGEIALADGNATPAWLARLVAQAHPRIVILATCFSGQRDANTLRSMAEEISVSGINCVAMFRDVGDQAAICYDTEFLRAMTAGANVREAHSIALEQVRQVDARFVDAVLFIPGYQAPDAPVFDILMAQHAEIKAELARIREGIEKVLTGIGTINEALGNIEEVKVMVERVVDERDTQRRMIELLAASQQALLRVTEHIRAN